MGFWSEVEGAFTFST